MFAARNSAADERGSYESAKEVHRIRLRVRQFLLFLISVDSRESAAGIPAEESNTFSRIIRAELVELLS